MNFIKVTAAEIQDKAKQQAKDIIEQYSITDIDYDVERNSYTIRLENETYEIQEG